MSLNKERERARFRAVIYLALESHVKTAVADTLSANESSMYKHRWAKEVSDELKAKIREEAERLHALNAKEKEGNK